MKPSETETLKQAASLLDGFAAYHRNLAAMHGDGPLPYPTERSTQRAWAIRAAQLATDIRMFAHDARLSATERGEE